MKYFLELVAIIATAPVASPTVARPILVAAVPLAGAPHGAHAYRVVYHSTDGAGKAVDVTGVVIVPAARAPVVAGTSSPGLTARAGSPTIPQRLRPSR